MSYAEVVFNIPVNHAYTYKVPDELSISSPGIRVLAPFGKRTITGIVITNSDTSPFTSPKNLIDVLDTEPLISVKMLELMQWISEYYMTSLGQTLQLALPKGIDIHDKEVIHLVEDDPSVELSEKQRELYLIIGSNPGLSKDYYRKKFGQGAFYAIINILENKGLISRESQRVDVRVRELIRKYVIIPKNYTERKIQSEKYLKYINRRPEIDEYMMKNSGKSMLMSEYLKDTSMASETLKRLCEEQICSVEEMQLERKPEINYQEVQKNIILTDEQISVISEILKHLETNRYNAFLLHGVTGSGKTQVYIEILKKVIAKDKSAIILIPEISLTPQTVSRFENNFGGQIAVFHSKMSAGERYDAWMACYHRKVKIVVGPRSALFVPLHNIGLIVVDEEHETTYKQADIAPRYHARDVALYWAKMNEATVILGSATPSLDSYFNTRKGKFKLLEILNRVDNQHLPEVTIIDLKRNRPRVESNISLFSNELLDKIRDRLAKKQQVILLQNRRGYSSFLQCKNCGFIPLCPNCDVTLTYHSFNEKLQCHLCGHKQPGFYDCPTCGGKQIVFKGVGTQRIQKELAELIPEARILRMDQDTTRSKNSHDLYLNRFGRGEVDILLGTQMIAKGLDFSNVTLVGVISADIGLAQPDFRAAERVFHLLTQVAGRSGRGVVEGEVVVQSYIFSHYSIQFAKHHDYSGFYMYEMQHRKNYNYPPYVKLIQILVVADKMGEAISNARLIAINLKKLASKYLTVIGPAPAVISRMNNLFRWQVLIKINPETDPTGKRGKAILQKIVEPLNQKNRQKLNIIVDVDPIVLN
ncbi:MAG: primosomal protein N' [Calditrichaceae bacterium]|nr:primosomal protein N' [Calditrichaceae bacterium]